MKKTPTISKILEKRGITSEHDLSLEERATLNRWKSVFTKSEITVDQIKAFCQGQISIIQDKIANGVDQPTAIQLASLHVYLNVLKMIRAPEAERENLEHQLNQIINE